MERASEQSLASAKQSGQQQQGDQGDGRPIAQPAVRRHAAIGLDAAVQHAGRERRQGSLHGAVRSDDGSHAGIGGAQHRAAGFQCAHAGDLQVLRLGQRIAEPRGVRQVGQDARLGQGADDLAAENVLVADVGRHLLPGNGQRRLLFRAAREGRGRDVGVGHEPREAGRDEFAVGHQMTLAIGLQRRGAETDGAVVIGVAVARQRAEDDVAVLAAGQRLQRVDVGFRQLVEEDREGGFRQERQLRRIGLDQFAVEVQGADEGLGPEFHFLRDVALDQRDADRFALGRRPFDLAQGESGAGQHGQHRQADPPAQQQSAAQRKQRRQPEYAKQRGKAGQRAGRRLRIADGQPREAGEKPAANPVAGGEQAREEGRLLPEAGRLPALEDPAGSHRK